MGNQLPPASLGTEQYKSPGELLSVELANQAEQLLATRDMTTHSKLDDGSRVRSLTEGNLGSSLTETTSPDGMVITYQYDSFHNQADDKGSISYTWARGGNIVQIDTNMELAGKSREAEDITHYGGVLRSNLQYLGDRLPERKHAREGRVARILGRLRAT